MGPTNSSSASASPERYYTTAFFSTKHEKVKDASGENIGTRTTKKVYLKETGKEIKVSVFIDKATMAQLKEIANETGRPLKELVKEHTTAEIEKVLAVFVLAQKIQGPQASRSAAQASLSHPSLPRKKFLSAEAARRRESR